MTRFLIISALTLFSITIKAQVYTFVASSFAAAKSSVTIKDSDFETWNAKMWIDMQRLSIELYNGGNLDATNYFIFQSLKDQGDEKFVIRWNTLDAYTKERVIVEVKSEFANGNSGKHIFYTTFIYPTYNLKYILYSLDE